MTRNKSLTYNKCFCCCKNYNVSKLIEINTNSVVISDENLSFEFLLLDVCLLKIDSAQTSFICEDCKDQIVNFHMFKRDILQYPNLLEHQHLLDLLYQTSRALNSFKNTLDIHFNYTNESIIISSQNDVIEEHLLTSEVSETGKLECHQDAHLSNDDETHNETEHVIEEISQANSTTIEMLDNDNEEVEEMVEVLDEEMNEEELFGDEIQNNQVSQSPSRKKYKYKVNTNDSLTKEQIEWIREQTSVSEIYVDGKRCFKCQICGKILRINSTFKKHLRDCHVLKTPAEREERSKKMCFKDEIKRCRMEIQTSSGIETIWKCERCKYNRIFKSEPGFKVHLRYNHIKSEVISADFIAKCKVTVETEKGTKNGWKCVDCQKVVLSRDALRYHMKLEHKDTVAALSEGESLSDLKDDKQNNSIVSLLEANKRSSSSSISCCDPCGLKFINGTTKKDKSLEIHQQLHEILKVISQSYELPKCLECKIMYSNNEEFYNHLSTHDRNVVYPAEGMSFFVAVKFKEAQSTSNDENSWKCGHCENVHFKDETECIEHQMILHSKQLICPFDYLEFTGIRGLGLFYNHMKNKHPEMFPQLSIFCSYCGDEFNNVFDKLTHMKTCDTKKYHCDHCQKTFFKKNQLIRHLKIVSGDISFTCEVCSKKCSSSMDLKLHLRKHTNEKTYQCSFPNCYKIFKTPAARSSHMEIHSNIEYECTDCKSLFKQRALLQRHLKKTCKKGK